MEKEPDEREELYVITQSGIDRVLSMMYDSENEQLVYLFESELIPVKYVFRGGNNEENL